MERTNRFVQMQLEHDPSIFSQAEIEEFLNWVFQPVMPDWKFYLVINGLRKFLVQTESIHQRSARIGDLICTYYKKGDSYENGRIGDQLYRKYFRYIRSERWKSIQEEIFRHYGHMCQRCASDENLQILYKKHEGVLFHEDQNLDQITVLCTECRKSSPYGWEIMKDSNGD